MSVFSSFQVPILISWSKDDGTLFPMDEEIAASASNPQGDRQGRAESSPLSPLSAAISDSTSLRTRLEEAQQQLQITLFPDEREKAEQARKLRELLGVDTPSHRSPARVIPRKFRNHPPPPEEDLDSDSTIMSEGACPFCLH
jgi:hypothetical protein